MFVNEITEKEHNELIKLVGDLFWDWDRLSSSGQQTLEKIADLLGDREIIEDKWEIENGVH